MDVARRVASILGRLGEAPEPGGRMELRGEQWLQQMTMVLEDLSFSERAMLFAGPVDAAERPVPVPDRAELVLERLSSPWFPGLLDGEGEHGLRAFLQPIVDLADGGVVGREALARATLGDRLLTGAELKRAAAAHHATFAFDVAMRDAAFRQALPRLERDVTLFVNFIPSAVLDPDESLQRTWDTARQLDIDLGRVCLEIVETEKQEDVDFLRGLLGRYRAEGISVALDDLGAGCQSLGFMSALRPDYAKLDSALIRGIDTDGARQELVHAIVGYGHSLGTKVVAEGVETPAELAVVRELGVDLAQGYYLGRPTEQPTELDPGLVTRAAR